MLASLPHFYKAEQLLEGIESGLHPKKKDHGIAVNLEIVCLYERTFFPIFSKFKTTNQI